MVYEQNSPLRANVAPTIIATLAGIHEGAMYAHIKLESTPTTSSITLH